MKENTASIGDTHDRSGNESSPCRWPQINNKCFSILEFARNKLQLKLKEGMYIGFKQTGEVCFFYNNSVKLLIYYYFYFL